MGNAFIFGLFSFIYGERVYFWFIFVYLRGTRLFLVYFRLFTGNTFIFWWGTNKFGTVYSRAKKQPGYNNWFRKLNSQINNTMEKFALNR